MRNISPIKMLLTVEKVGLHIKVHIEGVLKSSCPDPLRKEKVIKYQDYLFALQDFLI